MSQSMGKACFPEGLFPAYRSNPLIGYSRPDTTLFFSAIICFMMQSLRGKTSPQAEVKLEEIIAGIKKNYPDFRNKDGLKTYNFWKTSPSRHFPNGYFLRHFDHFRIPDDADDTSFVYLTDNPTEEDLHWLKQKLAQHANGSSQWIKNTYPEYRALQAYSTWFGKKMYVEFDACVLSNILYVIFQYKLPLNQHDSDSMRYIRSVVETDRYLTEPFRCAHQYPNTVLMIYHVSRLVAAFDPEELRPIRTKLTEDAQLLYPVEKNPMCRVLLATSLLWLGQKPARLAVENYSEKDFEGFFFFIAGLLTAYEHPWLYRLASQELFHMRWTCTGHCWALLAEYESLYQEKMAQVHSNTDTGKLADEAN